MKNIQEFTREITDKYKTGKATEHTYRSALEKLILGISGGKLQVLNEGKASELHLGKPDLVVKSGDLLIGCVEAKDIDKDLSNKDYKEQFTRYKNGIENLIITNCLDWEFYRDGQLEESVTIGTLRNKGIDLHKERFEKLLSMLQEFTNYRGLKITSSKNLASIMANRARGLKVTIQNALKNDAGKSSKLLKNHLKVFRKQIMTDLDESTFADMYAQTITYGLFVARLNHRGSKPFSRQEAINGVSNNMPFLKNLFNKIFTDKDDIDDSLNWDIDNLINLFKIADRKLFAEDEKDLFIHFYEDFLKRYDEDVKMTRGVFYTPVEVVKYIVNAVDEVLQTEFKLKDGLADKSKTCYVYEEKDSSTQSVKHEKRTVDRVQVLDPATGTGTFLVEVVRKIHEKYRGKQGMWNDYVEKHLLENIHGFEILMTPYVMCHLKLNMVLKETGYEFKKGDKRYNICLTNALDKTVDSELYFDYWLEEEAKLAKHIKDYRPIKVVIGNPPYNMESSNKSKFITDLMEVYKNGLGVEKERNRKPLSDDYLKFLRLSESFIERNTDGIVAFITNNSFLGGVIHRQARKHLLETFDKIYIINLHGNTIIGEKAPDGSKDESVFDVTVGTSINILVKTSQSKDLAKVYYKDVYGLRDNKYSWLSKTTLSKTDFTELSPKKDYYFFVPKALSSSSTKYDNGFRLDELFAVNASGATTHHDDTLISYRPFKTKDNREYAYRPFDTRYVDYDLKKVVRARYKVMKNFILGDNLGLCTCRQQQLGVGFKHVLMTTNVVDAHFLCGRAYVYPLYIYDEVGGKSLNFRPATQAKIESSLGMKLGKGFTPENLLDYIYGVLHSNKYRNKYKEQLKIDFPRIPYPVDKKYFFTLAGYGERLRKVHLHPELLTTKSSSYIEIGYPKSGDNIVSAVKFKGNKVYVNETQYFENVPEVAWKFYVGNYQPLQKWLKDRKKANYTLTSDDLGYYEGMVNAIIETIRIMDEIDRVIQL